MGLIVEKCGFRMTLVLAGCILIVLSQILNVFTSWVACQEERCASAFFAPIIGSLGMPALYVVLLGSFPYMAIPQIYGVAIGFAFTMMNTSYVLFFLVIDIFLPYDTIDISSLTPAQVLTRNFSEQHSYIDSTSFMYIGLCALAAVTIIVTYLIEFKWRSAILHNKGSQKTAIEFKKYFNLKKGFF